MTDMKTRGKLQQAKGRIRAAWGALTDDDMERAGGNVDSLVGRIKERTGKTAGAIHSKLGELLHHGADGDGASGKQRRSA